MQNNTFHSNPQKNKERTPNMCKAILEIQNESKQLGIEQGIEQGISQGLLTAIKNAMHNTQKSFEEVCSMLGISKDDMPRFKDML